MKRKEAKLIMKKGHFKKYYIYNHAYSVQTQK